MYVSERGDTIHIMVEKWKQGVLVAKKGGPFNTTTPPPTWRLELPSHQNKVQEFLNFPTSNISARKLCANLWEIQHPLLKMNKPAATTLRHRRRLLHHRNKDTVSEVHNHIVEPPHTPSDQPAPDSSMKRHVAASLVQRHRSVERNGCAVQPVSPASCSSSVEVTPYKCAETPTSSLDDKGMIGESRCSLTTSTDLLKVLDRIWSLEEQHASNMSAVKALKMELDDSKTQIKELLREKQINRKEMENLMKQVTVEKFVRRNKKHARTKSSVQSLKEELEDKRRLRKHSESLHRKLARELSEVKSSFSNCLRNLERERKARILLENLCDEFAKGIRDYEQEVHSLRRNSEKSPVKGNNNSLDRLILHISEAWLDERMQMKLPQADTDLMERVSIVDKLGFDIESFLHAKRSVDFKKYGYNYPKELREIYPCQPSLDSFPLQDATSAPKNMAQENSINNDFLEPKATVVEGLRKLSSMRQRNNTIVLHQESKGNQNSVRKEVISMKTTENRQLQANMERNMPCNDNESCFMDGKSSEIGEDRTTLSNEEANQDLHRPSWTRRMNSSHRPNTNLIGNSSLSSEGDKVFPESVCREVSCDQSAVTATGSPVKLSKSDFDMNECCKKLPKGVKENTLMAKLLEARLEGQKSRSRASKSTS